MLNHDSEIDRYDLILVYTSHRRHNNYINIVKQLGFFLRIGIIRFKPLHKWDDTEERFLQYCLQYGAKIVEGPSSCYSLMLSRFGKGGYYDEIMGLAKKIKYEKVLVNVDAPLVGFLCLKEICETFGQKPILLVPSVKHFGDMEPDTKTFVHDEGLPMVEIGATYHRYPIFDDFETDYMLAYPSHTTINDNWEHFQLLKNMVKVIKSLPPDANITVKPHNIREIGNRLSDFSTLKRIPSPNFIVNILISIIHLMDRVTPKQYNGHYWPNKITSFFIVLHNKYIFNRCSNLLDNYPAFGFEQFVSGIKKGVITGLSQTIAESMMQRKPVCRCDILSSEKKPASYRVLIDKFQLDKSLTFNTKGFNAFDDDILKGDLIEYLRSIPEK